MSIEKWSGTGAAKILASLLIVTVAVRPEISVAAEVWNVGGEPAKLSAVASASALDGVIMGLQAFRDSELEGVEARQAGLKSAAEQLGAAYGAMVEVPNEFADQPAADMPASYEALSGSETQFIDALAEGQTPETLRDLYDVGAQSTANLASFYEELAERSDGEVFGDFLDRTYGYLRAGAAASELLQNADPQ